MGLDALLEIPRRDAPVGTAQSRRDAPDLVQIRMKVMRGNARQGGLLKLSAWGLWP